MIPIAIAAGAASWSLAEWLAHNYLGHVYAKNRNFFAVEHVRHHATTSYFAPSYKKAIAAAVVSAAVAPVASALCGTAIGVSYTVGFVGTYLGYEVLHRLAHVSPPRTRYGRWLRKHHFHHHFKSPHKNHGVTSPLWDLLFQSYEDPGAKVKVPARHAMSWLCDEHGEIWPAYRQDYELRGVPPTAASYELTPS